MEFDVPRWRCFCLPYKPLNFWRQKYFSYNAVTCVCALFFHFRSFVCFMRLTSSSKQDFHIRWGWLWIAVTYCGRLLLYRSWASGSLICGLEFEFCLRCLRHPDSTLIAITSRMHTDHPTARNSSWWVIPRSVRTWTKSCRKVMEKWLWRFSESEKSLREAVIVYWILVRNTKEMIVKIERTREIPARDIDFLLDFSPK
jgi:hypothetical protein